MSAPARARGCGISKVERIEVRNAAGCVRAAGHRSSPAIRESGQQLIGVARTSAPSTQAIRRAALPGSLQVALANRQPTAMRRPMAPRIERTTLQVARRCRRSNNRHGALFHLRRLGQRACASRLRQGQVLEEDLHEFFLAQVEDEVVVTLARVTRLALAPEPLPTAAFGPLDAVATHVFLVARDGRSRGHAALSHARTTGSVMSRLGYLDVFPASPCRGCRVAIHGPAHRIAKSGPGSDAGIARGCRSTCSCRPAAGQ